MSTSPQEEQKKESERAVLAALDGLRFGSVEITVHDGRIVQIERKEKIRPNEGSRELKK